MTISLVERDALKGNLLDRIDELERRVRYLEDTHPGIGGEAAAKLAYYREADGSMHAPADLYPDGDLWGIWSRRVNRGFTPMDHFRSGTIPTGFSWINDGTFGGAPGSLLYSYQSTYLGVATAAGPNFLADAITTYANKMFVARLQTGYITEIGVRLDDGSDNNYAEIILDADNLGAYNVDFRYRAGGGAVTDNAGPAMCCSEAVVVGFIWYAATPNVWAFLIGEHGAIIDAGGFSTGALGWTPARVGIVVRGNNGNYAYCDWFYSDFS